MEKINFLDLNSNDAAKVLMKLSTLHYKKINDDLLEVNIGKYKVSISSPDNNLKAIRKWNSYNQEPICKKLADLVMLYPNYGIGTILDIFKKKYQVKGEELRSKEFFKFYHKEKPSTIIERKEYGRTWIDYESQLRNGSMTIYDSNDGYGIWAMNKEYADYKKHPVYLKRYGKNLMIVRTISGENYIKLDNQIVGSKFEVIKKYSISN